MNMLKKEGDPCPFCHRPLTDEVFLYKRHRKVLNALNSLKKAQISGNIKRCGRKPLLKKEDVLKMRNTRNKDNRNKFYSYREIAKSFNVSASTIGKYITGKRK